MHSSNTRTHAPPPQPRGTLGRGDTAGDTGTPLGTQRGPGRCRLGGRRRPERDGDRCLGATVAAGLRQSPCRVPAGTRVATAAVTRGTVVGASRHRVRAGTEVPPPPRPSLAVPMHPLWSQAPSSCATRSIHCATAQPSPQRDVTAARCHRPRGARTAPSATRPTGRPPPPPRGCGSGRGSRDGSGRGSRGSPPQPREPPTVWGRGVGGGGFDLSYSHRGKNERVKAVCIFGERPAGPGGGAGTARVRSQRGAGPRGK